MFAYCLNSPVRFADYRGYMVVTCHDDSKDRSNPFDDVGSRGGNGVYDPYQNVLDTQGPQPGYNPGCVYSYNSIPNWVATGRTEAENLHEQLAMEAAKADPYSGTVIIEHLGDPRLNGFSKYVKTFHTSRGTISVHYVGNPETNTFDDFKFK
jgi:hypothetical protein